MGKAPKSVYRKKGKKAIFVACTFNATEIAKMERKYDKKVKGLKDHLRARGSDVCEDGDPLVVKKFPYFGWHEHGYDDYYEDDDGINALNDGNFDE